MTDDKLIEKLRSLRRSAVHALGLEDVATLDQTIAVFEKAHAGQGMSWMDRAIYAEAMLAEKAHAPTNDEREAAAVSLDYWSRNAGDPALRVDAAHARDLLRRSEVPEPLADDCECEDREALVRPEGLVCGTCGKVIEPRAMQAELSGDEWSKAEGVVERILNRIAEVDIFDNDAAESVRDWAAGEVYAAFHRTLQGGPTDAEVIAALEAYWGTQSTGAWGASQIKFMRRALRAAFEVRGEGR